MSRTRFYHIFLLSCLFACGGDPTLAPQDVTSAPDISSSTDEGSDLSSITETDAELDAGSELDAGLPPVACTPPPIVGEDPVDLDQKKFALSLFHYNIQYVIGGLEYKQKNGETIYIQDQRELVEGWDNARVEDWIVTETFAPILEMYDKHPNWRVNFELQGYFIEVLAERHPETLALLRKLAQRDQVELVSFHWAAQLFLAFPKEDLKRSLEATRAIFEKHCLPLSAVVFNQEGQAGEGWMKMLVDEGYKIGIYPKNLFKYAHGEFTVPWPLYDLHGGTLIVGPGGVDPESGVQVAWDFFDDGELRAVPKLISPYLAPAANQSAERVADFEAQLQEREDTGFKLTHVSDYVHQLQGQNLTKKPAPPLIDGTWQPTSTNSIHRWLGGKSIIWHAAEEDNNVRSGNARARMHVAALQVLVEHLESQGHDSSGYDEDLAQVWRMLWSAEVSDCTGVNPWRGEVLYCLETNEWLVERCAALRGEIFETLGITHAQIDLKDRVVTPTEELVEVPSPEEAAPPLILSVTADGRLTETHWSRFADNHYQVEFDFSAFQVGLTCSPCSYRRLKVSFPQMHAVLEYSPALNEDEIVTVPFTDFFLQTGKIYLPLPNGLIGLGNNWYAIKHNRTNHIAVLVRPEETHIDFEDQTAPKDAPALWRFDLFQGSQAEALEIANRINIYPVVAY